MKLYSPSNIFATAVDGLNALLLATYALLLGPLGILKGPLVLERTFRYIWVLAPAGSLSRSVRAAIDWRAGNFDIAIAEAEGIISILEKNSNNSTMPRAKRRVLEDLYTLLTRAYLHAGHIDDAMLVVIRAKKILDVDRLPGLAELNSKTAHLVRAGLSAGRLLDGGGLATLFVKSPTEEKPKLRPPKGTQRQGAEADPSIPVPPGSDADEFIGAKIIPFPGHDKHPFSDS